MTAIYVENEPFAAAWLRGLIAGGKIAPGDVDERDLRDIKPVELLGYTQVHLCAGIGVWSLTLRNAGWPDDTPVWTVSCPCQPFSTAGAGKGFADERHLWPSVFHLIEQCGASTVFGEQVADKDGLAWLDLVQADMEALAYAFGFSVFPAAGVGAPHPRHRTYWVADSNRECDDRARHIRQGWRVEPTDSGPVSGVADYMRCRQQGQGEEVGPGDTEACSYREDDRTFYVGGGGPTKGFWSGAEWLPCTDGKMRPTEPGLLPLAHGVAGRVGLIRGYGNAICEPQARAFIESVINP